MSIVFDQDKEFTYIYRYINGAYETTDLSKSTEFDLFPDDAGVDDFIIFGNRNPGWSYHDITFNIGTALKAIDIDIRWERWTYPNTWTEIPNVTDNTNAFRNIGVNTVEFDIPKNMSAISTRWDHRIDIGGYKYSNWIRCRIVSVNTLTEGGRTQTDTVKCKDGTITVDNETSLTLSSLQSACDSGGWMIRSGVKAVETLGAFTIIRAHLYIKGATGFKATHATIQMGEPDYKQGFRSYSSLPSQLGELDTSGKGKNGCMLDMYALFDGAYDYVYNVQAYGSVIHRTSTQYGAFSMGKVFKFIDSSFNSPSRWYLASYVSAGSEWVRSVYADTDLLYLYSGNLLIDTFKTLDAWQGLLCGAGRPAVFKNTDINSKKIMRYYAADIDMIDCTNIDTDNITNHSPNSGYPSLHVRIKYHVNLRVLDAQNSPISGAKVILKDGFSGADTFTLTTDSNGSITEQLVTVFDKWWERDASWLLHEDNYNDFTLIVTKPGYQSYREIINIMSSTTKTVILKRSMINIDTEVII